MEYLSHRHSDLYAGAKGQRRIGGRKTAFTFCSVLFGGRREMSNNKARLITAAWMWTVTHCNGWYSNVKVTPPLHKRSCLFSLLLAAGRGGAKRNWKKSGLFGIHLSLRINKGNLGWFLPVGLLAERRGEGSDTAELQGAGITLKHTLQITALVWESRTATNPKWCNTSPGKMGCEGG